MNADKDFVFNLRSSAFIGGWDFFTASQGAGAQSLMALCLVHRDRHSRRAVRITHGQHHVEISRAHR